MNEWISRWTFFFVSMAPGGIKRRSVVVSRSSTVELKITSSFLLLPPICAVPQSPHHFHIWIWIWILPQGNWFFFFLCHVSKILSLSRVMEKDDSLSSSAAGSIDLWIAFTEAGSLHYCSGNTSATGLFSWGRFPMDFNKVLPVVIDAHWSWRELAERQKKSAFSLWQCEQQDSLKLKAF